MLRATNSYFSRSRPTSSWIANKTASATAPRTSETPLRMITDDTIEPTATVTTKSKLDSFEKLRRPAQRV